MVFEENSEPNAFVGTRFPSVAKVLTQIRSKPEEKRIRPSHFAPIAHCKQINDTSKRKQKPRLTLIKHSQLPTALYKTFTAVFDPFYTLSNLFSWNKLITPQMNIQQS